MGTEIFAFLEEKQRNLSVERGSVEVVSVRSAAAK